MHTGVGITHPLLSPSTSARTSDNPDNPDNLDKLEDMKIPEEIRAVPRPKNTYVRYVFGKYYVISQTCVRFEKRNIPVDLGKVGEIVGNVYVAEKEPKLKDAAAARAEKLAKLRGEVPPGRPGRPAKDPESGITNQPDILSYGPPALYYGLAKDLLVDLSAHFELKLAKQIFAMALIRATSPGVTEKEMKWDYENSFYSEYIPGIHLGEGTIPGILSEVGKKYCAIRAFMKDRVRKFTGLTAIDGTLKSYESEISVLSAYSHKFKVKGVKDICDLYAYDVRACEPICMKTYIGSAPDSSTVPEFMEEYGLKGVLTVDDTRCGQEEGLEPQCPDEEMTELEKVKERARSLRLNIFDKGCLSMSGAEKMDKCGVAYLAPLKRNSKLIAEYGMDTPMEPLLGFTDSAVQYKKCKTSDGKYLYSFRDAGIAHKEEVGYITSERKKASETEAALRRKASAEAEGVLKEQESQESQNGTVGNRKTKGELVEEMLSRLREKEGYVFDAEKFEKAKKRFGLVTYISEADLDPLMAYLAYDQRWSIEVMLDMHKNILELGPVDVHDDYRVIATEFINFLSTIIGCREKNLLIEKGIYGKMSQPQFRKILGMVQKVKQEDGTWAFGYMHKYVKEVVDLLGI